MTLRQKVYWEQKMRRMEQACADFYRQHPRAQVDGSFLRKSFSDGYKLGKKEATK